MSTKTTFHIRPGGGAFAGGSRGTNWVTIHDGQSGEVVLFTKTAYDAERIADAINAAFKEPSK